MAYGTSEPYEYQVFLGTLATALPCGVEQLRTQTRDEPNEAFSAAVDRWVIAGTNVEVFAGAVTRRRVSEDTPGVVTPAEPWELFCYTWEAPLRQVKAVNMNRQVSAAPGAPMRNPLGLPVVLREDRTRPNQPAQGEPARDPWTGELTGGTQP